LPDEIALVGEDGFCVTEAFGADIGMEKFSISSAARQFEESKCAVVSKKIQVP
jgi:formyltetrahydrofolate synthetase